MDKKLHIDVETYSSIDIFSSGSYKYIESLDFEVLMIAYCFDHGPIEIVDLSLGDEIPLDLIQGLENPEIIKCAHNANFERNVFKSLGFDIPVSQWECTAIKAAYCGLPISLGEVSKALNLGDKSKLATGKALIRYFCCPIKPTKKNGLRSRNFPKHDPEKWQQLKDYCVGDVEAEREIDRILKNYNIPDTEKDMYALDQKINDKGILVDLVLAQNAFDFNSKFSEVIKNKVKEITGLENPNSPAQLKKWIGGQLQKEIKSLAKEFISPLIKEAGPGLVSDVLNYRKKLSKSSIKKYTAMLNCACDSGRAHGLFQFYGANRTGRWAGRLIQLQNLPRNYIHDLDETRKVVYNADYDLMLMLFDDVSDILSQLVRTSFIAKPGHTFAVADFSAIEARVIAWLADETWRVDVFKGDGKIYEASAAMMFNVPIEEVTKGSDLRHKGKTAELALGYQGSVGALRRMGGEQMGLSDVEMKDIVTKWRNSSPKIVKLWKDFESCAKKALIRKQKIISTFKNIEFDYDGVALTIKLPSGRKLFYWNPKFKPNKFGGNSLAYKGVDQTTKQWLHVDTYGGKIVENVVQAIARDLLVVSMVEMDKQGFDIVMHVHDEASCEIPNIQPEKQLQKMCDIMGEDVYWAKGLPLNADGYITKYYKKD